MRMFFEFGFWADVVCIENVVAWNIVTTLRKFWDGYFMVSKCGMFGGIMQISLG